LRDYDAMRAAFLPGAPGRSVFPAAAILMLKPAAFDRALSSSCGGTFAELSRSFAAGKPTKPRPIAATVEIALAPKIAAS